MASKRAKTALASGLGIVAMTATYLTVPWEGVKTHAYWDNLGKVWTVCAGETERQDAANNAAKQAEAQRISEIQAANQSLQNRIEELQREADQDPDAEKPALGASSVRRINQVR